MADVSISNSIHHKSPLDSLVRQSSRRAQRSPRLQPSPRQDASPTRYYGPSGAIAYPSSPLLHTRFRTSASTATSTDNSFMDLQDDGTSTANGQDLDWNRDDESIYSAVTGSPSYSPSYDTPNFSYVVDAVGDSSPTLPPSPTPSSPSAVPEYDRQSWASQGSDGTVRASGDQQLVRDTWRSSASGVDPFSFKQYESSRTQVPKLVVSSPSSPMPASSYYEPPRQQVSPHPSQITESVASRPGRTQYSTSNFSRPIRPPTTLDEQRKREVLERNRSPRRSPASTPSSSQQQRPDYYTNDSHSGTFSHRRHTPSPTALHSTFQPPDPPDSGWAESSSPAVFRSSSANAAVSNSQTLDSQRSPSPTATLARSVSANPALGSSQSHIRLPNSPPSPRPASKASVYSAYSFYQLDDASRTPSPNSGQFPLQGAPNSYSHPVNSRPSRSKSQSRAALSPAPSPAKSSMTPDEYLLMGIQHHEANRLSESASCFERAATLDGGCGVGMLMWGLSLRHAWGTEKDEKAAYRWLRRAAEAAVGDLEAARGGQDQTAVQTELVLAIYEVGQCFFHGWGVSQDKKMAVSYFQVAARLGDCDAQQELGYCLANGKGCKKDLKEAAKWYRAAVEQGASTVGLAWIYKSKYT